MFPILLAHGALGAWDEIIFVGVSAVFFVMMGVSWARSRAFEPELEEDGPAGEAQGDPNDGPKRDAAQTPETGEAGGRFELK